MTVDGTVFEPESVSGTDPQDTRFTVIVPAGRVFLLGDRRDITRDSRTFLNAAGGTLPMSAIKGRAVAVVSPLTKAGRIDAEASLFSARGGIRAALAGTVLVVIGGGILAMRLARFVRRRSRRAAIDPVVLGR